MTLLRALVPTLAILLGAGRAAAQATLDPYTVTSPDGKLLLSVNPTEIDGAGPARYAVTRAGKPVWQNELPFTLWKAALTDDGTVCGFAYDNGHDGRAIRGRAEKSQLLCAVIDNKGVVRAADGHERKHPPFMSTPPSPYEPLAMGVTLDVPGDRFIVRVAGTFNDPAERWWSYKISTGAGLGEVIPEQPKKGANGMGFHKEIAADLVPGTPLLLVHWFIYPAGARFALLDEAGKEVWKLDRRDEYADKGDRFDWWSLIEQGIHQTAVRDHAFDVISYTDGARISHEVAPDGNGGFTVKEIRRVDEEPRPSKAVNSKLGAMTDITLEPAGTIELHAPAPSSPIDNVHDFNFDSKGRIGFVRFERDAGKPRFVLVNPDGSIAREQRLELPENPKATLPMTAPVEGDRWIIVRSSYEKPVPTEAWWLNVSSGALTAIPDFKAGRAEAVRALPGPGFAIQGRYDEPDEVIVFGPDGARRTVVRGVNGMMHSAAVRTDGTISVLTAVRNTIETFDAEGKHVRSDSLEDILDTRPNYPATLRADVKGGIILEDFGGTPPIYRISAEGKLTAKFTPRFSDGRAFRPFGGVQVAPDGTLWTSDSHALLRLDEKGVVDKVLGPAPTDDAFGGIAALAVGSSHIYVSDSRSGKVHVFDTRGERLRVVSPGPSDFGSDSPPHDIAPAPDGSIWLTGGIGGRNMFEGATYFGFDSTGKRLEPRKCRLDQITETWHFQPKSTNHWALGYEAVWLVNAENDIIQHITRRPDGAWLGTVHEGAVAPDGSLAVISGPRGMGSRGPAVLNIYDPAGEPVKSFELPDQWILMRVAFTGRWAVTAGSDTELHLYDVTTGEARRFAIPEGDKGQHFWTPFISPDASEVWLYNAGIASIARFRLPRE